MVGNFKLRVTIIALACVGFLTMPDRRISHKRRARTEVQCSDRQSVSTTCSGKPSIWEREGKWAGGTRVLSKMRGE